MEIRHLTSIAIIALSTLSFNAHAAVTKNAYSAAQVVEQANTPRRGISQADVLKRFGKPYSKEAAVGKPPISSWSYGSYDVYFEGNLVLHTVAKRK
jgi:hypothetical protein